MRLNVLCIGDVVGRPGRRILADKLRHLVNDLSIDCVIVNAENAAGGSGLTPQIYDKLLRYGVNIVCLIWEDRAYGLIEWKQDNEFKTHYDLSFTNPDFVKLAEAFGGWGKCVTRSRDLRPALEEAFDCGRPALVTMDVDYNENRKLSERLGQIVCPI